MENILDVLVDTIELYMQGYPTIRLADLPDDGDTLMLSDARTKILNETITKNNIFETNLRSLMQLYVRLDSTKYTYSQVYTDLLNLSNLLQGLCHNTIKGYRIEDIVGTDIIYLGKDNKNNLIFSYKFNIKYNFSTMKG